MNRRTFLRRGGLGACAALASGPIGRALPTAQTVRVRLVEKRLRGSIPTDFLGLGYEISSVAQPGLLSRNDRVYTQLVRTLGPAGVIRIGGNTADYALYAATGQAVSTPKGTVVNRESLRELAGFLHATGWKLIWGLDLGQSSVADVVEEAEAVSAAMGAKLLAFEIGNEPDLFVHEGHRQGSYTFADYLADYRRYKAAIRARLPRAPFAGPDVAGHTDWVQGFADAEGHDLKLLTHHYYRGGQSPASSYAMLLNPDPKLVPMLQAMQRASVSTGGVPYRICETNSFSGGGRPGISGTFGAALWVLDYFFTLAMHDAAGVNLETGVNQLGFVSSYSPIGDDGHGTYTARPEYYGMLAFARATEGGKRLGAEVSAGSLDLTAYAVGSPGRAVVTVINKDRGGAAAVELAGGRPVRKATAMRLRAPSIESDTGVTLGGAEVGKDGRWSPAASEPVQVAGGVARIEVPPVSAALVTLSF